MECFPLREVTGSALSNQHMDMRIPFQITTERMQCDDHTRFKMLLMILVVKPVREDLGSGAKKDMKKRTVFTEVRTQFFSDGKNNMAVSAVDELERNGIRTVRLISSSAGITESGMTAERNELVCIAVRTNVKRAAEIRIAAVNDLLNFSSDHRADIWIFKKEGSPMICKDLLDGKSGTHNIT